ncbi:MAG TPA: hypothetical protein VNM47_17175, partial [Terriglobia bacterium]|nr:hypothetical protein [Terriglobia bacterium]
AAQSRRVLLALSAVMLVILFTVLAALNVAGLRDRLLPGGASPGIHSIAVLPVENLSGDPQQEYFADGMTEELITRLSKIGALRVTSRTSAMRYKGTKEPVPQIAQELNVDAIMEDSLLREGSRVRFAARLIDARTEKDLWAESYTRDLHSVLTLQSDVALAVAREIRIAVTPQEKTLLARTQAVNPAAYEAYLKGRSLAEDLSAAKLDAALEYFNLALEKQPDYAPAYIGIAQVWSRRGQMGLVSLAEAKGKAMPATVKALELDPTLAEGHFMLAAIKTWVDWNWSGAESEFKKAIGLNPSLSEGHAVYSHFLMLMGRPEEASQQIQRAMQLDPLNAFVQSFYAVELLCSHRYDDAIAQDETVLKVAPGTRLAHDNLWSAFNEKQEYAKALNEIKFMFGERILEGMKGAEAGQLSKAEYVAALRLAAGNLAAHSNQSHVPRFWIAKLYAEAHDNNRAVEWLEKSYQARESQLPYLKVLPAWDDMRSDPRVRDILRRMNFPGEAGA